MLQTDLGTLTPSSHWSSVILGENNVLLWPSDDQKGAYYVFLLPEVWLPFMTFAWPVPGYLVGLPHEKETYVGGCQQSPFFNIYIEGWVLLNGPWGLSMTLSQNGVETKGFQ